MNVQGPKKIKEQQNSTMPMPWPEFCPMCGSRSVQAILADTLLAAHVNGLTSVSVGVLAYRCDGGHVFLVMGDSFKLLECHPDGNGHVLMN